MFYPIDMHSIGGHKNMNTNRDKLGGYILSGLVGAVGGGLLVAIATRAIPKMAEKMMSGMMKNMMSNMNAGERKPSEI